MNTSERILQLEVKENSLLLQYIRQELKGTPAGKLKAYLKHRQISVDGVVTTQFDYPLHKGQLVCIDKNSTQLLDTSLPIIYEDDWLLAIHKPAGLLSVSSDHEKEKTAYRILKSGREGHLFVVHRLDKDTSGVLLFAKSEAVKKQLQDHWDENVIREYYAVCEGVFEQKQGRCDTYLNENSIHKVYSGGKKGKRAITNYQVLKENDSYSYLKITIETGRKNQIRVHMSELGHPVVGDKKYGSTKNPLKRLGLHASRLEIIHPVTKRPLCLIAKPSRHFTLPSKI